MKSVLFFILSFSINALARPEIMIPSSVEISQREILRLGDIAVVSGFQEEHIGHLDSIVIRDDSRALLLSQKLEAQEILNALREGLKNNETLKKLNPLFKVPSQVAVSFSSSAISRQEAERRILNTLRAKCHQCEFQVSVHGTPVPSGKQWFMDMSGLSTKGGFLVPVKDGTNQQTKWISGTIRVSKLTPVTTRMILQGEKLKSEDVRMEMTDVTFAKDSGLQSGEIDGKLAARMLPVGTPLWASDLKQEPAAKRGQIVKALLGDSTFEVSVYVEAQENGFIGDQIKVKNLETKKILSGTIEEKGVVRLQ